MHKKQIWTHYHHVQNHVNNFPLSWGKEQSPWPGLQSPVLSKYAGLSNPIGLLPASLFASHIYHAVLLQLPRFSDNLIVPPMMKALWMGPVHRQQSLCNSWRPLGPTQTYWNKICILTRFPGDSQAIKFEEHWSRSPLTVIFCFVFPLLLPRSLLSKISHQISA